MKPCKASAHAKAILSGEHAVLYGCDALITPLKENTCCYIEPSEEDYIQLDIPDFKHQSLWRPADLKKHFLDAQKRLSAYKNGTLKGNSILSEPTDLAALVLGFFFSKYGCFSGANIVIESSIMPFAGMGSSSALVASMVKALLAFYQLEMPFDTQLSIMQELECYQHGKSSGIDLYVSYHNQTFRYQSGSFTKEDRLDIPGFVCFSGHSKQSTAECVAHVKPFFKDPKLAADFQDTSTAIYQALKNHNHLDLMQHIQKNHALLCHIGVVPDAIQEMIDAIEKLGAAAKICGAGALSGNAAGLLWIVGIEKQDLPSALLECICFDL